jgi:N-acetylglucosaminyldiphosphoundecaprenol N-acetyl-beta-D-mannosaminyltransferase
VAFALAGDDLSERLARAIALPMKGDPARVSLALSWGVGLAAILTAVLGETDFSALHLGSADSPPMWIAAGRRLLPFAALLALAVLRTDVFRSLRAAPAMCLCAFAAWILVSAAFTPSPFEAFSLALWTSSGLLLAVWAGANMSWRAFAQAAATVFALWIVVGVGAHLLFGERPLESPEYDERLFGLARVSGLGYGPNEFGKVSVYLLIAATGAWLLGASKRWTRTCMLIGGLGLALSQSRTAILAAVVGLCVLEVRHSRSIRRILLVGVPTVAVAFAGLSVIGFSHVTSRTGSSQELATVVGRTDLWRLGLRLIGAHPVFGLGAGEMKRQILGYADDGFLQWRPDHPHNVVLQIWGTFGLIALLLLVGAFLTAAGRLRNAPAVGFEAVLIFFAIRGLTESNYHGVPSVDFLMVAFVIGALSRPQWARITNPASRAVALVGSGHLDHPGSRVKIAGFPLDTVSFHDTIAQIDRSIADRSRLIIATGNLDFMAIARRDATFCLELQQCDLVVPDGVPLLWLARLAGFATAGRVNGTDLAVACVELSNRTGARIAFVGGEPSVAGRAAEVLQQRYPNAHMSVIPTPKLDSREAELETAARTAAARPDVVLVGLGAPRQERWMLDHLATTGASVGIGVGGSFEMIAGTRRRAPRLLQRTGLEWLWRMVREPRRLAGRYLLRDLPEGLRSTWEIFLQRARGPQ